jgi:hypothetical protein
LWKRRRPSYNLPRILCYWLFGKIRNEASQPNGQPIPWASDDLPRRGIKLVVIQRPLHGKAMAISLMCDLVVGQVFVYLLVCLFAEGVIVRHDEGAFAALLQREPHPDISIPKH